ncbi:MAG: hypothetical protein CL840_13045 [Crocinitomicaceae bacterium]|nr:hypothetical protein [Crocinitomicaceae bacterium]|tara:strand:- start:24016 stop:25926 length:1911 start_codon:yes stop_codon:yes gene_type:complete
MIFNDNYSFLLVIAFIVVYNAFAFFYRNQYALNILLVGGSIIILSTISSIASIGIVLCVSALVFFCGKYLSKREERSDFFLLLFIGILVFLFVLKNYNLASFELLHRIGLSYILFRLIHFLVESSKKNIVDYNLLSFLNYIIYFPSFIAGPIDEFNNFNYWIKQKRNNYRVALFKAGTFRLLVGIIKKFFIVPIIASYALDFASFDATYSWQISLFLSLIFYSFYILFDFSGYSDIAIGSAYLLGVKTPENFNNPYSSASLSVFWKKWHMTFSNFLFKYIFKPLVTFLSNSFKKSPRLVVTFIGYLLTFIICGIWHGNTLNFLYWGLWHGVGLMLFKLYDIYVYRKRITKLDNQVFSALYKTGAVLVTFSFVTFGWFFFNYNTYEVSSILDSIVNPNSEKVEVNMVKIKDEPHLRLVYKPTSSTTSFIEIEYETYNKELFRKRIDSVEINASHTYYLKPLTEGKRIYKLKVRSISDLKKENWNTVVSYFSFNDIEHTSIQKLLFGENVYLSTLDYVPEGVVEYKLDLPAEILNQKIIAIPEFVDGYGWAIRIKYKALSKTNLIIEYRRVGEEWILDDPNRSGIYSFTHIHGTLDYQNTPRNLASGNYEVKITYFDDLAIGTSFTQFVTIPDYAGGK